MLNLYDKEQADISAAGLSAQATGSWKEFHALETTVEWNFRIWTDGDLAALVSRNVQSGAALLAAAEMRLRTSWQTPARWSLVVSFVALAVSIAAIVVSIVKGG